MRISLCTFFILFITHTIWSQALNSSDSLTAVLSAKESEMFAIITNADKTEAEKLITEDYVTINADGVMEGKEKTMETIGKFKGSVAKLSDKKIRVYGNIAIINGRAEFYLKQLLVAEIFYTEIWDYRNGQWQFIGWQGTMTGAPSYYPVILTCIVFILLLLLARLIFRRRKKMVKATIS